jgi:RimJ/RimL family protein N-acetyltransferase
MNANLFTGQLVRLAALDAEASAEQFARWDRDMEYLRLLDSDPRRLLTAKQITAEIEKQEAAGQEIAFVIRTLADDQMIGFVGLDGISWPHGDSFVGSASAIGRTGAKATARMRCACSCAMPSPN